MNGCISAITGSTYLRRALVTQFRCVLAYSEIIVHFKDGFMLTKLYLNISFMLRWRLYSL